MKFIENQNTWETCISALNELDLSSMHIHQKSTDILNESDHKKITDAIANMAKYSAKEDGTFEKSIQRPIMEDGRKGRNCRKSYFFRMARHYWLQEKLTMEDYSKERILCATIHSYIGNVYYFPIRKDVFKGVFELGMKLVEKRECDIFCDDFLKEIENQFSLYKNMESSCQQQMDVLTGMMRLIKVYLKYLKEKSYTLVDEHCLLTCGDNILRIAMFHYLIVL